MELVGGRYTVPLPFGPVYGYARWSGLSWMRWEEGQIDRVSSLLGLSERYLRDRYVGKRCIYLDQLLLSRTPDLYLSSLER